VASLGKFPTKSRFKRHILNSWGELMGRKNRLRHNPASYLGGVGCQKVMSVYAEVTFEACGPFAPDSTSYFTA